MENKEPIIGEGSNSVLTYNELLLIAGRADNLERWLGKNAGHTADWPVDLKCDGDDSANTLAALLSDLQNALRPFRAADHNPACEITEKLADYIHAPCTCRRT